MIELCDMENLPAEKEKRVRIIPRHRLIFQALLENPRLTLGDAIRSVGYSESVALAPTDITESASYKALLAEQLSESLDVVTHKQLLTSQHLDHMVFALGPKNEKDKSKWIEEQKEKARAANREFDEKETLTDLDIAELLREVGCTVRKIVHRETARDVYFWSPDNVARDKALDKSYKLKGKYAPEKHAVAVFSLGDLLKRAEELNGSDTENESTNASS